jgi:hypothetical protein
MRRSPGLGGVLGGPDDRHDQVDRIERDQQPFDEVQLGRGPGRAVLGASAYHVEAVLDVVVAQAGDKPTVVGTPLTSTTLLMPKVSSSGVWRYSSVSTAFALTPALSSIVMQAGPCGPQVLHVGDAG